MEKIISVLLAAMVALTTPGALFMTVTTVAKEEMVVAKVETEAEAADVSDEARINDALLFLDSVLADDVDAYYDRLSDDVRAQLPYETLAVTGQGILADTGALVSITEAVVYGNAVTVYMTMENMNILAQVIYGDGGEIIGFGFVPNEETVYDTSLAENEEEIAVGPHALSGVLTMPEADAPVAAVVLVHGSGPNDRNETLGNTAIFRDIAQGLSAQGIAVLRYDKRTYAMNQGIIPYTQEDALNMTVYDETIEDAVAAVSQLREDERIDPERVFILGHSQGAILATRMQQEGAEANGLILLAGTTRHIVDLMAEQLENLAGDSGAYDADIELARTLADMDEETARAQVILGSPAYILWEETQYDLVAAAEENTAPMLILQGDEDVQVFPDRDYPLWVAFAEAHPDKDMTLYLYPGLGHVFVDETGAFSSEALADIVQWIQER